MKKNRFHLSLIIVMLIILCMGMQCFAAQPTDLDAGTGEEPEEQIQVIIPEGILQNGQFFSSEEVTPKKGVLRATKGVSPMEGASQAMYEAAKAWQSSVNIYEYRVSASDFERLLQKTINDHGDLFHWDTSQGVSISTSGGYVYAVKFNYDSNYTAEDQAAFYEKCSSILASIPDGLTDAQKLLFLHDYIVINCTYDLTYSYYDAYHALMSGTAVCQGYALAYSYLCKQLGFEIDFVSAINPNEPDDRHAWNLVVLDGEYYYVDCTWDDPTGSYEAYCGHSFFLRSRDEFGHAKYGTTWTSQTLGNVYTELTTSTTYDSYYWVPVISAIPFIGTTCAYVYPTDGSNVFMRGSDNVEHAIPIGSNSMWFVWGDQYSYYTDRYLSMTAVNGDFYFSTASDIYRLKTDGTLEKLYTLSSEESAQGYLYGIVADGNNLAYSIGTKMSNTPIRKIYELPIQQGEEKLTAKFEHSCSFQNRIELNYKLTVDLTGYDDFWLVVERQDFKGEGTDFNWAEKTLRTYSVDGKGRYVFTYDDIAAAEMGEELRARLCAKKGDDIIESDVDKYSIMEYAYNRLEKSDSVAFKKLMVDMLNYGAAAQTKFKKNTNNLVNKNLTTAQQLLGTQDDIDFTDMKYEGISDIGGMTAEIDAKSVSFNSTVDLNIYTTYGGNDPGANVKVVLSYQATSGKTITETVTRPKFVENNKKNYKRYIATFSCVATPDFGQPLTIVIYDGSTQISETYTYSIATYAFNRLKDSSDDDFKALLKALMKYSASAQDAFKTEAQ
ncbi:MAG: hypothetical protein J5546_03300 [Lachnospiraceae bacterium]|nr:hypothetical protein [Lachnospiraceae bacterium]